MESVISIQMLFLHRITEWACFPTFGCGAMLLAPAASQPLPQRCLGLSGQFAL